MKREAQLLILLVATSVFSAQTHNVDEKRGLLRRRESAFVAMDEKIRDPYILLAPDGNYYLTGTTSGSHWGDTIGVKIWQSADLCKWNDMGYVWLLNSENEDCWFFNKTTTDLNIKNQYAIWAPELHYINDNWWITISRNGGGNGMLRSSTGRIEGPYEMCNTHLDKGIDSHLFCDQNAVYYAFGAENIFTMSVDMSAFENAAPHKLMPDGKHPMGYEGIYLMKYEDSYIWLASGRYGYEPTDTYDLYYATSKELMNGYSKRRMALKNCGHGNIFRDKEGNWWCTAFDHEYSKKWCCWLVPIEINTIGSEIIITSIDSRFNPSTKDQRIVDSLSVVGVPEQWRDKKHWWRP